MRASSRTGYELHNEADGYQDTGGLEEMKRLGRDMIADDKRNHTEWVGPYWITDEDGNVVYRFFHK